ncbi:MAG: TIGR02147 family protein [Proteobacteria bacterium]|nr:MAG: TIGR02147 family protein [Pseudomonadota bacterium]
MVLDPQQLIGRYLTEFFFRASKKNPQYSIRAFAKKLGVSNSSLSEIMRGKRVVSKKKALEFASELGLSSEDIAQLEEAFENAGSLEKLKPVQNPFKEILIGPDQYKIMADWKYFAVLALIRTNGEKLKLDEMASSLELSSKSVKAIVAELEDLGIVTRHAGGILRSQNVVFRTSEDFPEELMRKRRLESIEGAALAINQIRPGELGIFATVSTTPEAVFAARPMLEDFVKRLCLHLRDPKSPHVFEIGMNLFPRTVQKD